MKYDIAETTGACHSMGFAAWGLVNALKANPDLLNMPGYKDLVEKIYVASCEAASMLHWQLNDKKAGESITKACNELLKLANL